MSSHETKTPKTPTRKNTRHQGKHARHGSTQWWKDFSALAHNVEIRPVRNEPEVSRVLIDGTEVFRADWMVIGEMTDLVEAVRRVAKERNDARAELALLHDPSRWE